MGSPPERGRGLDLLFRVLVVLKGLHGALELASGLLLLFFSAPHLAEILSRFAWHEMYVAGHPLLGRSLSGAAGHVTGGGKAFAVVYLLVHGGVKLALLVSVFRHMRRWYPVMLVLLGGFLLFELVRLAIRFSPVLAGLAAYDLLLVTLLWREYRRSRPQSQFAPVAS